MSESPLLGQTRKRLLGQTRKYPWSLCDTRMKSIPAKSLHYGLATQNLTFWIVNGAPCQTVTSESP